MSEVYEETRIRVARVAYVKSQPWPFPDSLMIGFTADYQSGDIVINPCEIAEAAWFRADDLPLVPDAHTLAGQLISAFANKRASDLVRQILDHQNRGPDEKNTAH